MYVRVEAVRRIGSAEGDTISSTSQTNGFVGNDKDQHAFSVPNRSTVGYPGLQVSMFFRVLRVRERWRCSRVSSIPNAICPPIHSQKCAFSFAGDYRGPDRFLGNNRMEPGPRQFRVLLARMLAFFPMLPLAGMSRDRCQGDLSRQKG